MSAVLLLAAVFTLHPSAVRAAASESDDTKASGLSPAPAAPVDTGTDPVANSVVKVFSTVRYPDPYKPWTK